MSIADGPIRPDPLSDVAPVPDMPTLAAALGALPGSHVAHLLAACNTGGFPVVEALRAPFPDVVTAWETWRRTPNPTAGDIRAALGRTPVRAKVGSSSR